MQNPENRPERLLRGCIEDAFMLKSFAMLRSVKGKIAVMAGACIVIAFAGDCQDFRVRPGG